MKVFSKLIVFALALLFVGACEQDYIDPISSVDPGSDEAPPEVDMTTPTDGSEVNAQYDVSEVSFHFEVTDDIELGSVEVELNGESLVTYNTFNDYRVLLVDFSSELGLGDQTLVITAEDLSGKTTVETINFTKVNTIRDLMAEAILYMDYNGDYEDNVSSISATVVGTPTIETDNVVDGSGAYHGAAESYLTFPATGLHSSEFSASMFLNVNGTPDRAGILVMGPEDTANPDAQNDRSKGFRFFREAAGDMQRFKLNVGNGEADTWFDGGAAADVDPTTGAWVHFAFTISDSECIVYINGEVVKQGEFGGVDWTGCDLLSIMSGAPRFNGWGHNSNESLMDELLIFDRVLTQQEVSLLGLLAN